jgi:peptidyl-prolyl cis-trans isomerase C
VKYCVAALALSSIPALFAQAPAPAADKPDANKVILTIGNEKITAAQYDEIVSGLPQQYQAGARGAGKRQFAEQLAQLRILAQEGEKEGLDKTPAVKHELEFSRDNIIAGAEFRKIAETAKVDDAATQKYYEAHKGDYETLKAKHILIHVKGSPSPGTPGKPELSDEEALKKAQDIRKRLIGGEDFAKVARAESDDAGSGAQGGELGEFKKGMMVPPFEQAAFAAKPGEVTEPVKSPFGYHVIVVESHVTKPLAEVKPDIEQKIRPDMARQAVDAMVKKQNVVIDDAFFGPPPMPQAPPAAK